jgi:hypothetical protein
MFEKEVILLDHVPDDEYDRLLDSCVKYALLSFPFTVNRMSIDSIRQRILNIAKGKIAEALFWFFCKHNNICPDFKCCRTAFWETDKKDFILGEKEWDIKNNFIYHATTHFENYIHLPALIPNRFDGDQWSKRFKTTITKSKGVNYLFTFLKNAGLNKFKERETEFLKLLINNDQERFLEGLYTRYKGKSQRKEPYTTEWFWQHMKEAGPQPYYYLMERPSLAITGFADKTLFYLFKDTGPGAPFSYQEFIDPVWYTRSATKGSINFLNSTLWTTIKNATCPVAELPSFLSLFPHLKQNIRFGRIKK